MGIKSARKLLRNESVMLAMAMKQVTRNMPDGDRDMAANSGENLMPYLLEAARVHASEGETVEALQEVWGDYREAPVF